MVSEVNNSDTEREQYHLFRPVLNSSTHTPVATTIRWKCKNVCVVWIAKDLAITLKALKQSARTRLRSC